VSMTDLDQKDYDALVAERKVKNSTN
jgi:hypothetical protein